MSIEGNNIKRGRKSTHDRIKYAGPTDLLLNSIEIPVTLYRDVLYCNIVFVIVKHVHSTRETCRVHEIIVEYIMSATKAFYEYKSV